MSSLRNLRKYGKAEAELKSTEAYLNDSKELKERAEKEFNKAIAEQQKATQNLVKLWQKLSGLSEISVRCMGDVEHVLKLKNVKGLKVPVRIIPESGEKSAIRRFCDRNEIALVD